MKKILLSFVAAMAASVFTHSLAQESNFVEVCGTNFYSIAPPFSHSGKTQLYTRVNDETENVYTISIYDENLNLTKTFSISKENLIENRLCNRDLFGVEDAGKDQYSITQTLFNNDEKYEYIRRITKESTIVTDYGEYTRDILVGIEIVSEDGTILQTIDIDEKYQTSRSKVTIMQYNGKYYLICNGENVSLFYPINKTQTGIKSVEQAITIPSGFSYKMSGNGLTLILNEVSSKERKVIVVDAAGKLQGRATIPAGANTITVDAPHINMGLNIVSVTDGLNEINSCKIIVQ